MGRVWAWVRIVFGVLVTLGGISFLIGLALVWFQARDDISRYQAAHECPQEVSSCYQTLPGTVTAASFESTNSGTSGSITVVTQSGTEDIAVGNIDLARDGVHAGDAVEVRYWQGKARLLLIHGDQFPTVDDPSSELSSTPSGLFVFGFITSVGVISLITGIRSIRRLRRLEPVSHALSNPTPVARYVGPPATEADPQTVVIRPSAKNLRIPWVVGALFVGVLAVVVAFNVLSGIRGRGWSGAIAYGILLIVFALGVPALSLLSFRTSRVLVGPQVVTLTGIGAKSCDRGAVARIVKVSSKSSGTVPIPMALLLDAENRTLLRVSRAFDIDALGHELKVPLEGDWEPASAGELARRYPGSVSSLTVNATAIGIVAAAAIMIVLVIVMVTIHPGITYNH
jgi:hypothetical protein